VLTSEDEQGRGKYRIGTVAQLTGLTADTIRMWERRYATVSPLRSEGGTRLYGDEEVTRLQLMRALTESGDPIGAIANLPTQNLRERLARLADLSGYGSAASAPGKASGGSIRIAVLDPALPEQMRVNPIDLGHLELVGAATDVETLAERIDADGAEVLVAHLALLGPKPVEVLQRCREICSARLIVVIYDWATRRQLTRLAAAGVRLVRGPVHVASLRQTITDLWMLGEVERHDEPAALRMPAPPLTRGGLSVSARRFDDEQIARLREVRSSVDCECPNHLAGLIGSLVAFERYSEGCESRTPEDAALHALLHRGTAEARAAMEDLLVRVCEQDGIKW
jgi:MerR family transcriptional regulator, light-induced transcriptional regulator